MGNSKGLTRREMLAHGSCGLAAALLGMGVRAGWAAEVAGQAAAFVMIENFSAAGQSQGVVRLAKVHKTDAQWRQQLSAEAYEVTNVHPVTRMRSSIRSTGRSAFLDQLNQLSTLSRMRSRNILLWITSSR